ncbi:hypothetical protein AUK10_02110 [Candidatus Gracilibacteria bacterium CG2_30_37_12]|nr:MAG: hypothetical protein AUK10_02110 [Candidatus Gracilibacteria bacterium CG2_30_37_12]
MLMKNTRSLFFSFFFLSISFLSNSAFGTENINTKCFKEYANFTQDGGQDVKVEVTGDKGDTFFLQDNKLVPYKVLSDATYKYIDYTVIEHSSGPEKDLKNINDANNATVFTFDNLVDTGKSITIDFGKQLIENTFDYYFIFSHRGNTTFFIGDDLKNLKKVKESAIGGFSFRYLKIDFTNYSSDTSSVKTEISEINFFIPGPTILVLKPFMSGKIEAYKGYDCESEKLQSTLTDYLKSNRKTTSSIDASTKEVNIIFDKNPNYNTDFDGDRIGNDTDNCKFITNKNQLDSDSDGIGDECDLDKFNKNPNDGDTDKDGIANSIDNCKYLFNPDQRDSNADGIGDACSDDDNDGILGKNDNCPNVSNADQKDVNANGIGDACEFDKDKDGIFDGVDNCINTSNPDQKDSDNDGIGDVCDNCKLFNPDQRDVNRNNIGDACEDAEKYAKEHDTDKDGILDFTDNCPKVANPDQKDTDHDGIGDACDNCLQIQNTNQEDSDKNGIGDMCEDTDHDGIDGFKDNCPTISNADQKDSDNNGTGDLCEDEDYDGIIFKSDNCPYDYNPNQSDIDKDGKGDVCDTKDDRYMESNKGFFAGIMILIVAIFGLTIFGMVGKLKKE